MTSSVTSKKTKPVADKTPSPTPHRRWWLWGGLGVAVVLVIGGVVTGIAFAAQSTTIVRNTSILGQPMGGQNSLQALERVTTNWEAAKKNWTRL